MTDDYDVFKGKIAKEDFESRIKEKIKEFQGLLTREGAITIIASELGVQLGERPSSISIKISDIIEGMTNVDIVGKIIRKSDPKEFVRKTTDTKGKVLRLEIGDESGTMPVVLWDEKVDDALSFKEGDVVKVIGGFAKKGLNEKLELTVQRRGSIEASDETVDVEEATHERVEIGSLQEGMSNIRLIGTVVNVSDIRNYEREDRSFKVCSLFLKDNTGQIRVSLWNQNADKSAKISIGDIIAIENCYAKYGFSGMEVQTNSYTRLDLNPVIEGLSLPTIDTDVSISDITSDMQFFSVTGTIIRAYEPRSFEREDGSQGLVATVELQDDSGTCRVSLWDDKARIAQGLPEGTSVVLEGCRAREGLDGVEVSVGASGRVMPRLPDITTYTTRPSGIARVIEIKDGAIKAASREGQFLIITDEQGIKAGELISYEGVIKDDNVIAKEIGAIEGDYPSIDELLSPPRASIGELEPERLVHVQGLVRQVTPVRDFKVLRLDDGSGIATGYFSGELEAGREYDLVARTFQNGEGIELYTHSAEYTDNIDEAYRLLDMF